MRCDRCGAVQNNGSGYCGVCAAPLGRIGRPIVAAAPAPPLRAARRTRWLTAITLAAVALLVATCAILTAMAWGLSSVIRWA